MLLFFTFSDDYDFLLSILSEKINSFLIISSHSALFDLSFFWLCLFKLVALNYKSA